MKNAEPIRRMQHAQRSHEQWARRQERRRRAGKHPIRFVGGETFHRRWVAIYKAVVRALKRGAKHGM